MRVPPLVLLRAMDSRPFHIHDILPSDTRFKVLVFIGDVSKPTQLEAVKVFATWLAERRLDVERYDVVSIGAIKKKEFRYNDLPIVLRSHWTK